MKYMQDVVTMTNEEIETETLLIRRILLREREMQPKTRDLAQTRLEALEIEFCNRPPESKGE